MKRQSMLILVVAMVGCGKAAEPGTQPTGDPSALLGSNIVLIQAASAENNFRFPGDKAGGFLAQLLRPAERLPGALADAPSTQKGLTGARGLENPQVPLSAGPADLPRRTLEPAAPAIRPRQLGEGMPLAGYRDQPVAPTRPALATARPVALPSADVREPAPVPALNPLLPDRVPFDDPSAAASREVALSAAPPVRTNPVAFTPENLPDPFANAQTVRLRQPPAENPQPRP